MGFIYKITSPSGKAYIGKTEMTTQDRFKIHASAGSKCPAIKAAFVKYGKESMKLETLKEVPDDQLNRWEFAMILINDTYGPNGYNLTPGGDDPPLKHASVRKS